MKSLSRKFTTKIPMEFVFEHVCHSITKYWKRTTIPYVLTGNVDTKNLIKVQIFWKTKILDIINISSHSILLVNCYNNTLSYNWILNLLSIVKCFPSQEIIAVPFQESERGRKNIQWFIFFYSVATITCLKVCFTEHKII